MANKTSFVANKSAAKANDAMNKSTESRIKALRTQSNKGIKSIAKTQKIQQKKLGGK